MRFGNLRKIIKNASSVCLYNEKNITRQLEDMNFMFSLQEQYLTRSRSLVREIMFLPLEHKIHIFSPQCNILYLFYSPNQSCQSIIECNFCSGGGTVHLVVGAFISGKIGTGGAYWKESDKWNHYGILASAPPQKKTYYFLHCMECQSILICPRASFLFRWFLQYLRKQKHSVFHAF